MIDFKKLNKEYTLYWKLHNLQSAVENLRQIDYYISDGNYDTFLLPYSDIFFPENLIVYFRIYNSKSSLKFKSIAEQITYQDLLNVFSNYLRSLIKEISDYQKRILAENKLSSLDSIIKSVASLLNIFSSKTFVFLAIGTYIYNKFSKNK